MATVNFLYRSTKDKANLNLRLLFRNLNISSKIKDKETGLLIDVPYTDFVIGAKTKYEVTKHYWTKQHNRKRLNDVDLENFQTDTIKELNKIKNHILTAFNSVSPDEVTKEWLQMQIDYYYNPPKKESVIPTNLIDYIDYYIDCRKDELKETSIKKFKVIKHKLERFEIYRKKQILIIEIDDDFKNEFVDYQKEQLYSKNTRQREFVFIKTFCKHAKFKGIEVNPQLESLSLERDDDIQKIYLTFEDLIKIENIDKDKLTESLNNTKDWLIISAYLGQRISDFMHFTDKQIRVEDGKHLLEFTQKKTNKLTTIPVHPKVIEILNKRNGKFPYSISDQKYNDYIKEVCKLAELNEPTKGSKLIETETDSGIFRKKTGIYKKWELVTSHIGRRSFATNFYGKIPTSYLINITNHATESQFLSYVGKSNKDLAKETFKYF
ncbi:site-specific integrase [Sabulilitoribacter arenilitoris]|uniref:Site-specific integrase n=1 Tax=Wocania arenilitoris TaxID=2044858 RepID=A0AAE3ESK2_9FLAO|nr:phage integrase SAM-like domain-containing protein [Wocania arenilitoris]MCF7569474.1 site-specific integrase [Wocania arenilitoris]